MDLLTLPIPSGTIPLRFCVLTWVEWWDRALLDYERTVIPSCYRLCCQITAVRASSAPKALSCPDQPYPGPPSMQPLPIGPRAPSSSVLGPLSAWEMLQMCLYLAVLSCWLDFQEGHQACVVALVLILSLGGATMLVVFASVSCLD